jgi:protein TonB
MSTHHFQQTQKKNVSSLLITGALHAIALGLGLQATNIVDFRQPTIIELANITPPVKTPEPEKSKEMPTTTPTTPIIPPPLVRTERVDSETITVVEKDLNQVEPFINTTTNSREGTTEFVKASNPVHIAAQVDSNACEKPDYPASSIRNGEEGVVNLAMLIGPDGKVLESKVEKSSGSRALDKAAIQGLSLCKFKPGTVDGLPEKSWAKLQYVWHLN